MLKTVLAAFVVFIVFLFAWILFHKKKDRDAEKISDSVETFTCGECGDKHCNCYKDDDGNNDDM